MKQIKACIFDLDGVIVDTAKYHYIAWKDLANGLGFDFTVEDNERLKGVSRMTSLDILLEIGNYECSQEEKNRLAEKKNKQYVEYISKMTPDELLPGAKDFLVDVRKAGMKTALGSASKNAMIILNRLNIADLFDAIIDGTKVSNAKPDPEVFLKGAEELKVGPEKCVVFEDAYAGIEAALNANMKAIGIGSSDVLSKAHLVVSGLNEMSIEMLEI